MREHFMTYGASMFTYPVVGVYRHDPVMNGREGLYHVVICIEMIDWRERCFDAVVDDFGNLVRVQ
jgi:hypothetical protein